MTGDSETVGNKELKRKKVLVIKEEIVDALHRSTFHGIDIIMETPEGLRRIAIIAFVVLMSVFAIAGSIYALIGYLNFPYKTLVNYEQKSFIFTELTVCPFSPFTEAVFTNAPKEARVKYKKLVNFWTNSGKLDENTIMKYLKKSFTTQYYQYNKYLKRDWSTFFLSCFYNGENCLQNIINIEHPMAYQCFQISLNLSESNGARSGYARGLQVILFRNDNSIPKLMLNEFYDEIFGGFINEPDQIIKFDGVLLLAHSKDEVPAYKLTASPNNYPVHYGNRISITLKEKYYKQTKTVKRRCSNSPQYYKLLQLSDFFMSRSILNQKKHISLNLENCASKYRQQLISHHCKCFTENEMIPIDLLHEFKVKGFCHDILWFRNKSKEQVLEEIACSQKIELLPDKEILKHIVREKFYISKEKGKQICSVPCDRIILSLKRVQTNKVLNPLKLTLFPDYFQTIQEQNLESPFDFNEINGTSLLPENLIVIDIHAEEERIPILDEDRDKNFSNFLAEIGGVFGLFLGFSGVTTFEILECLILLLTILFVLLRKPSKKKKPKSVRSGKRNN